MGGRHQRPHNTVLQKAFFKSARLCGLILHLREGNIQKKHPNMLLTETHSCSVQQKQQIQRTEEAQTKQNKLKKKGFNSCRTKKLKPTSEIVEKKMNICNFFPIACSPVVICSYTMYKCSTIKKKHNRTKQTISTRNHAEVKEVQFELILALKLAARERPPRRHSPARSRQTENGTVNRHYTYIHRCKKLSPRSRARDRVHSLCS